MNWLLIIAIVILGGGAILGWRAGFVKTVFSLVSTIAVIALTLIFSPVVTDMLKSSEMIYNPVNEKIASFIDLSGVVEGLGESVDAEAIIESLNLPESIKDMIRESLTESIDEAEESAIESVENELETFEAYIAELLTNVIFNAIGFVLTFIIAAVGMAVLTFVMDLLSKLPVISQINTLAGAVIGAVEGLMVLWILFMVLTMLGSTEIGQMALKMITENAFLSFLYDNNIISKIVLGKL